jgi:hypothetical protein
VRESPERSVCPFTGEAGIQRVCGVPAKTNDTAVLQVNLYATEAFTGSTVGILDHVAHGLHLTKTLVYGVQ